MKKNRFYTISLKRDLFDGLFIREGKEWVLINSRFTDYMMDGFCVIRKERIESVERNKHDIFIEEVLAANDKIKNDTVEGLPLRDSFSLFYWIKTNNILVEIYIENKAAFYVGKVCDILDGVIHLHLLGSKGKWLKDKEELRMSTIEVVCWNTDYANALYNYSLVSNKDSENAAIERKLYSISIKGWKNDLCGVFEDEGDRWIILNDLFADFMLDGVKAVNRKYIETVERKDPDIFKENVLKANRRLVEFDNLNTSLLNTNLLFNWLKDNKILIGFSSGDQGVIYVGVIDSILEKSFYLKELTSKGEWENEKRLFRLDSVRTIDWNTDYLNSLYTYSLHIGGKGDSKHEKVRI